MFKELGASLNPLNLHPFFHIPESEHPKIYAILDICHMLKLIRNCVATYGTLLDQDNNEINWSYIKLLHKLQKTEGQKLANKLKQAHIYWWQQKIKVNLAAQVLSGSVADALEFCLDYFKLKEFEGCEATVKFIRLLWILSWYQKL